MQIILIPSQALFYVFTYVLKFSTGFLIICPNTTITAFYNSRAICNLLFQTTVQNEDFLNGIPGQS